MLKLIITVQIVHQLLRTREVNIRTSSAQTN